MNNDEFVWFEKYRPHTIKDTILPANLRDTFQSFVDQKAIPNLLLSGPSGIGKTTVARAMLDELECDYIIINGSMNGNIDTLRTDILNFASTMSFVGGRKYVILDEADYINPNSTQPALRNFMEEFSGNCGFVLTCNYKNKIIDALHSRCSVIDFTVKKAEKAAILMEFMKRALYILKLERIEYDKAVVGELILKYCSRSLDFRRVINELQRYSATGKIDSGILSIFSDVSLKELIDAMKTKNFTLVRTWVTENSDIDTVVLRRQLYDQSSNYLTTAGIAALVTILNDAQYQEAFVADKEINTTAMCVKIMVECDFK